MIHPDTKLQFIDETVGYGVFATKFIPEGTITYVKDTLDREFSPGELFSHTPEMQDFIERYSFIDNRGYKIVPWDFAKYQNHCCDCNTITTGYGFEFALRDIHVGEHVTCEYALFNLVVDIELVCCKRNCRKIVRSEDFERYYREWDKKIEVSLKKAFDVEQPLLHLLTVEQKQQLDEYFIDPSSYRSVYELRYHEELLQVRTA
jgi:uncharacterized protein